VHIVRLALLADTVLTAIRDDAGQLTGYSK